MRGRFSALGRMGSLLGFGLLLGACEGTVVIGGSGDGGSGGSGGSGGGSGEPPAKADKVDLLLVVDNSRSMADKQEILALALADLVQSLANPPCVDSSGVIHTPPADPAAECPSGQTRRHTPVTDLHVGVISTSIGGHGADSCPNIDDFSGVCGPNPNLTNNDRGHLLSRSDVCGGADVPTYENKGFLVWDPNGQANPPGMNDPVELAQNLSTIVRGVGQIGCGYESQLESWYRFLVEPEPSLSIEGSGGNAVHQGIDSQVLDGRASFLRPDSMLVILSLTDENDCSINETGQNYFVGQLRDPGGSPFRLPRPRSECATNPNDPCCLSCGQDQSNCPDDPTCFAPDGQLARLTEEEDHVNLRCFDQKRRFGIDFLYPVDRYVQALSQPTITNRAGELVANPIFSDLDPSDANSQVRDAGLVFLASISGVPWQTIARDPSSLASGFMNAIELEESGTWNALGHPAAAITPTDPYMVESIGARMGVNAGNPINGGDRTISANDDLQYACSFPLATPRDCSDPSQVSCDCTDPQNDNPLCVPDPNNNGARTLQIAAKAYPSSRTMSVVNGLGSQGVLTSICPAQTSDTTAPDYAYRPVVQALLERMATRL
jgi:hypothetical protein